MTSAVSMDPVKLAFDMPKISHGETVRYYPTGLVDAKQPQVATVFKVFDRSLALILSSGMRMDTVRHVKDPKLQLNKDQRESGAWDFTQSYYDRAEWCEKIEERLSVLEGGGKPSPPKQMTPRKKVSITEYQELRKKAMDEGIQFRGNPAKEWLIEQLEEKLNGNASAERTGSDVVSQD